MQQYKNENKDYIFNTRLYHNFLAKECNYIFPKINTSKKDRKYNSSPFHLA